MQKRCNGAKRNGIFSNLQLARTCSGKCLQQICQYCAFQRNATTSNCPLNAKSHPAGMHICYAIFAGISLRLCSISLRSFRITFAAYLPTHIKSLRDFFQSLLNNYRNNLYIISFFIYNRNYPDSVENPPIGTEAKAEAAIGDGFGCKFYFWWDFTYILHKLVLFHEKSLYLQKQDYQFH